MSNARRDGWLKTCSWMFESRVMDDFLFSWRVVWKYVQLQHSDVILCTEWTYSDSLSYTVLCMWHFVRFLVISRCDETLVATRASRSTRSSRSRLHDESDENTMSRAYVFTVTRAWGGRQTSSTRSDHKTNQRRTPSRHRQHSGTVSAAVTKLVRPKPSFCSQGKRRFDVEAEGFDVSRLIVAQGLIALHFVHFLPAPSAHY